MKKKVWRVPKIIFLVLFFLQGAKTFASAGRIDLLAGYFSLDAKVNNNSVKISNPSAFYIGYLKAFLDQYELKLGYTIMSSDFSGSDLGFGLNAGINYFPLGSSLEEKFKDQNADISRYEDLKPFVSIGFFQRSFQAVKISYAGLGLGAGVEKYYNEQFNLKGEIRYINLSGSSESTATETNLLVGIVYKL